MSSSCAATGSPGPCCAPCFKLKSYSCVMVALTQQLASTLQEAAELQLSHSAHSSHEAAETASSAWCCRPAAGIYCSMMAQGQISQVPNLPIVPNAHFRRRENAVGWVPVMTDVLEKSKYVKGHSLHIQAAGLADLAFSSHSSTTALGLPCFACCTSLRASITTLMIARQPSPSASKAPAMSDHSSPP